VTLTLAGRRSDVVADLHSKYLWWRGERVRWEDATVHVTDLAWSTVGAVFEGIRGYWNEDQETLFIFRLPEHLARLADSMKVVRLPLAYSLDELQSAIIDLITANESREDTYIRPLAYSSRSSGKRLSAAAAEADLLINTNVMPTHLLTGYTQKARISSWTRISDTVMPPRIKNISNYRNGQLATMEAVQDGYDVAFLLNPQGKVAEASGACVAMIRRGKLITPDVTSGILESITRDALLTIAREDLGIEVEERPVDRTEMYLADEVFTCGTAAEITPVVEVDRYQIGDGETGPVTKALEQKFHAILHGTDPRSEAWCTLVPLRAAVHA
jgi:branched-chain amino acid aminotransferase